MRSDGELLRRYAEDRSEDAFAELVRRHLNLVYSAALRQVNGDAILAEDIAQSVFTDLSRKASSLAARSSLTGWLYTSTHFATANALRAEQRRHQREREAHTMHELLQGSGHARDWEQVRPVLDQAMHELKSADREAILLRFFENRSLADVGLRLGLNENAARMRIERALEKLRLLLSRRGITTTAALSLILSTHAVAAAPAPMAAAITSTAIASSTSSPAGIATLLLFMKKLKLIGIAAILLLFTAITALVTKPLRSQPKLIQPAAAQTSAANASDIAAASSPINGVWNSQGRPYLDLQFDGRGNVTGTVVWWDGPTGNGNRVPGRSIQTPARSGSKAKAHRSMVFHRDMSLSERWRTTRYPANSPSARAKAPLPLSDSRISRRNAQRGTRSLFACCSRPTRTITTYAQRRVFPGGQTSANESNGSM